jgi:hypothetical protein
MLTLILFVVRSSAMTKLTERRLIQLTLKPGEQRDYAFPVKDSAVIFRGSLGFRALVGTGPGRARQFGKIEDPSPVVGSFFGPNLGRLRIVAKEECHVVFYALIPPDDSCTGFYISTTTAPFEISSQASANFTDAPGRAHCLWHIASDNRTYHITSDGLDVSDRMEMWLLNEKRETILGVGRVVSRGGIDFFYYRSDRNKTRNSAERKLRWEIEGVEAADVPRVGTGIAAGSRATVLGSCGAQVANDDRNEFVVEFSLPTVILSVVAIGMLFIVIVVIVVFTNARCRTRSTGHAQFLARAGEAEAKLLSDSLYWTDEGSKLDITGIPHALVQSIPFQ